MVYTLNPNNKFYISFARANREPSRPDFENGNPKPEELNDYELGWRFNRKSQPVGQLLCHGLHQSIGLTGALDDVEHPLEKM